VSDHVDSHGRIIQDPSELRATPEDLDYFDPELVLGYFRRLEYILDECPVEIYAASSHKHPWPNRLQNAAESSPASFWRSNNRMMDSAIFHPEITNADVLEKALKRRATSVVAKYYLPLEEYEVDGEDVTQERREAVESLRREYDDNVPARTSTQWFHRFAVESTAICFLEGRLRFGDASDDAPFPSMLLAYGEVSGELYETLVDRGTVYVDGERYEPTRQLELGALAREGGSDT